MRYLVEAIGVPYTEKIYTITQFEDYFVRDKPNLKTPLPNLPYLVDGDLTITEHDAILRYVARKYKPELLGKDLRDEALHENYLAYFTKVFIATVGFCH